MSERATSGQRSAPPVRAGIDEDRPLGMDLPNKTKALVIGGSMLAMFLSALEHSVVNPALPRIVSDLGGLELYPWLIQAFTMAQVVTIPVAATLSDSYGRKPLLLIGLVIFLAGTAACGAAPGIYELIAFRAVQGAGAGILMMSTFSVVGDLYAPSERGKYIGLFGGVFALSGLIGAPLGGVITEAFSWRWVFWSMLFVGPFAVVLIAWKMPWLRPPPHALRFDWLGMLVLMPMLLPLMLAMSLGGQAGWTSALVLGLLALSAVSFVLFLAVERRAAVPIVPLHLFKVNTIAMVTITMFLTGVGMMGVMVYLQVFLQVGLGAGAATAGLVMGPMIIVSVGVMVISGQIMARTGRYKKLAIIGVLLMLGGMALLSTMTRETSILGVLGRLSVFGIGMGLMMPVLSLAAQNAAPQKYLGRVSGFTQFFQLIGGAIGIGVVGALFNARLSSGLREALSPELVNVVKPEKLVDPDFRAELIATLGEDVWAVAEPAVQTVVANAITDNFLLAMGILVFAVAAMLLMREVPLRTGKEDGPPQGGEAGPSGAPVLAAVAAEPPSNGATAVVSAEPVTNGATALLPIVEDELLEPMLDPPPIPLLIAIDAPLEEPPAEPGDGPLTGAGANGPGAQGAEWSPAARGVAAAAFVGASLGLAVSIAYTGNGRWMAARRWAEELLTPQPHPPERTRRNGREPRRKPRR